jgi:hypothetical protein
VVEHGIRDRRRPTGRGRHLCGGILGPHLAPRNGVQQLTETFGVHAPLLARPGPAYICDPRARPDTII